MKAADYYKNIGHRNSNSSGVHGEFEDGVDYMVYCVDQTSVENGKFLDIGCQQGDLVGRLRDRFRGCYGVDIGDYGETWEKYPGCEFTVHDIDAAPLPYPDAHFDLVTCFMVLEHVFDVFGMVAEIGRVTRSGGCAILEVPNAGYLKHIISLIKGRVPRTGEQRYPFDEDEGWDSQHLHYFTLTETIDLCSRFGLETQKHLTRGRFKRFRMVAPSLLYSSITLILKKH